MPLLEVSAIHTAYGISEVLFGVSITVGDGECVGLLGRNGVGKSTMRSIIGLTPPRGGAVRWNGEDIKACPRTRLPGVASVPCPRIAACSPT